MFRDVQKIGFIPSKAKIPSPGTQGHGNRQPDVVRHKDQHQEVGQDELYHVKDGLSNVRSIKHLRPEEEIKLHS